MRLDPKAKAKATQLPKLAATVIRQKPVHFRGTYEPLIEYNDGDIVKCNGSSWFVLNNGTIGIKPCATACDAGHYQQAAARGLNSGQKDAQQLLHAQTKALVRTIVDDHVRGMVEQYKSELSLDGLTRRSAKLFFDTVNQFTEDNLDAL